MKTLSALLAFCARNSPITGEFPIQRPVTQSCDVFFDRHLNKRLGKQSWGWWSETLSCLLWRHHNERCASIILTSHGRHTPQITASHSISDHWIPVTKGQLLWKQHCVMTPLSCVIVLYINLPQCPGMTPAHPFACFVMLQRPRWFCNEIEIIHIPPARQVNLQGCRDDDLSSH